MPARLLAYGGTSFSERRRIGSWPAIPEATLRDTYALSPNVWSFGFGVLAAQPFLIFRQKQNIAQRGGYPFSLLLDPGEAVWNRFEWNAAAIIEALLAANPDALFRSPDACSGEALETLLTGLQFIPPRPHSGTLSQLIAAGAAAAEPLVAAFADRPGAGTLAIASAALPLCFRAGAGWLAGGGTAHGRAFGAAVVFDDQAPTTAADAVEHGRKLLEAWNAARGIDIVKELEQVPLWTWEQPPAAVFESVLLLRDIVLADAASDELVERAAQATALPKEVDEAITSLLSRGTRPLGPKQSAQLIRGALKGRKIEANVAMRLHRETLLQELSNYGSPPKPVPPALPVAREMRVGLWFDYLQSLKKGVPVSLATAFDQLGPQLDREERLHLVQAAVDRLPYSDDRLSDWGMLAEDRETWPMIEARLREEALQQFLNREPGAAEAYLVLGRDPGGVLAREVLTQAAQRNKLVEAIRSLRDVHPELAQAWLDAVPAQKVKQAPITRPAPFLQKASVQPELVSELRELLFTSDASDVEDKTIAFERAAASLSPDTRGMFDAMVEQNCATSGKRFANAFLGKYGPLGAIMSSLSDEACAQLLACLAGAKDFIGMAERDLRHAHGSPGSRNAYTLALSQFLLKNPKMLAKVGDQAPGGEVNLRRRLQDMVSTKKGSGQ